MTLLKTTIELNQRTVTLHGGGDTCADTARAD